jgi:aminoglycoside phosphotransferase (APT) family kinase protein
MSSDFAERLATSVRRRFGPAAFVADLQALSGGASAETWRFDVVTPETKVPLILQRMAGKGQFEASLDRALQARVQTAAYEGGVPVAPVQFVLDDEDQLGNGYVMQRIEGETLGPRILKLDEYAAARAGMTRQCGTILARIHSLRLQSLPKLPTRAARDSLDSLAGIYRRFDVQLPVFELALQWLEDHMPGPVGTTLVHGDFRLGNLIVAADGIRAVLDWEMTHIGDPVEDFGWICVPSWRFGQLQNNVGGFGKLDDLIDAYAAAGGREVQPERVKFWQVLGCLKWGLICLYFGFQHLAGHAPGIERAVIGRRTSETELDLLELMKGDLP